VNPRSNWGPSYQAAALVAIAALAVQYAGLALLASSEGVRPADIAISRAVQSLRSPALDTAVRAVTWLGDGTVIFFIAVCAAVALGMRGCSMAAALCFVPLLNTPLNHLLKQMVDRPRPEAGVVDVLSAAEGSSFPSGHSMGAAWFFGFLACLALMRASTRAKTLAGTLLPALVVLLVGFSRVYLGVHWPTDVLGGWVAGLALAALLALFLTASERSGPG